MKFNRSTAFHAILFTALAEAGHATHTHHASQPVVAENPTDEAQSGKPAISYEVNEFEEGDFKGFKFTVPEFNTMEAAVETYGADKVLSLLNTQINARIRTKVKNGLPKNLKPVDLAAKHAELLAKHTGGILFSEKEASEWRPEVRELSPNQLFKKAKDAYKKANETTDPAERAKLLAEGNALIIQAGQALAA